MIPITFNKDDSSNLKKGNIRGQDIASIISFGISKNAGILDMWQNPVSIIGNVTSTGYSTFTFNKGYICIYGRLIYIEQGETYQAPLPSGSSTVNGTFGLRINLGSAGSTEVEWFMKTGELRQDNILNDEVQGVYELGIYNYTATENGITLGDKIAPIIKNIKQDVIEYTQGANFITKPTTDNSKSIATTEFCQNMMELKDLTFNVGSLVLGGEIPVSNLSGYGKGMLFSMKDKKVWIGNLRIDYNQNINYSKTRATVELRNMTFNNMSLSRIISAGSLNYFQDDTEKNTDKGNYGFVEISSNNNLHFAVTSCYTVIKGFSSNIQSWATLCNWNLRKAFSLNVENVILEFN